MTDVEQIIKAINQNCAAIAIVIIMCTFVIGMYMPRK